MRQSDINNDLGSYIHERKSKPFWKKYTSIKVKPRKDEDIEVAVKEELKHDLQREAENVESHISPQNRRELEIEDAKVEEVAKVEKAVVEAEPEEAVEVVEKEHENTMQKFFKKLNFSKKSDEFSELENNPEIHMDDAELRELLHGLHNWIIQLPSDKLEKFKNSHEFDLYTKYLRKHNLIK